jgi:hypothetical protein
MWLPAMTTLNMREIDDMDGFLSVSGVARAIEQQTGLPVSPRSVSDLIYTRKLDVAACPLIGGRRFIPRWLLPDVLDALRERSRATSRPAKLDKESDD